MSKLFLTFYCITSNRVYYLNFLFKINAKNLLYNQIETNRMIEIFKYQKLMRI
jgi:hypothetical protein